MNAVRCIGKTSLETAPEKPENIPVFNKVTDEISTDKP
jgi:hypothetical protein